MTKRHEIDDFIERCGEVRVLERLGARFYELCEEGVIRPEREYDQITSMLIVIGESVAQCR